MKKTKIGVIGAGHLGKIHIKLLKEIEAFELCGFYDLSDVNTAQVIEEFGVKSFASADELIESVDAVDIVTPTLFHYENAVKVLRSQKHLFIEKPISSTVDEALSLIELAREANVKAQVGHVERFNPAFLAARQFDLKPMFIETHRLAEFNPRGLDVPVVLDLMIHDIDIMLHLVKSNVKRISASGVAVVSDTADICNARIEFDNGCVANLTSSRISMKNMRKTRVFQKDAYISIDFLNKEVEMVQMHDLVGTPGPFDMIMELGDDRTSKKISFNNPEVPATNAIKMELEDFAHSIQHKKPTVVSLHDGYRALDVAYQILDQVEKTMVKNI
ncbi:MAG: Gfo/Idh/MocA family oxidoreductase [Bacteroidota bacterium]|nr:Gfo/Idh/MocA family oxidoreductase [Bacteroidota bacterium]